MGLEITLSSEPLKPTDPTRYHFYFKYSRFGKWKLHVTADELNADYLKWLFDEEHYGSFWAIRIIDTHREKDPEYQALQKERLRWR